MVNFNSTNVVRPKMIWVPKSHVVLIAHILGRKGLGFKIVLRHWLLMTHDRGKVYVLLPKAS